MFPSHKHARLHNNFKSAHLLIKRKVEAEEALRQPILEKSRCSSVSLVDQNRTDLESSCADVSFPNLKF